ncbi:MAG TPA: DUF4259 domain-containing protein [Micromonosporaceae bacterium]|jgi:Domain of unknown function (DUF4259)
MGTWGTGPFENDDAADLCAELADADPAQQAEMLRAVLRRAADNTGYLEIDDAQAAIAAAAVVAAWSAGHAVVGAPELADLGAVAVPADLAPSARQALDRVSGPNSEWRSLWGEGTDLNDVLTELATIRSALPNA